MATRGTIIVTGASSGIGRAIAEHLSKAGYDVVGTSRSAPGLERLDVTDEASCMALAGRVLARTGRIDGLVNNAGQAMLGAQEECATDEVRALFEVNVLGAMRMTRAVLPAMRAARSGRIVHVGSVVGRIPAPFMGGLRGDQARAGGLLDGPRPRAAWHGGALGPRAGGLHADGHRRGHRPGGHAPSRLRGGAGRLRGGAGPRARRCRRPGRGGPRRSPRILATSNPRLAYAAGGEAAFLARAAHWLPEAAFGRALRRQFGLG